MTQFLPARSITIAIGMAYSWKNSSEVRTVYKQRADITGRRFATVPSHLCTVAGRATNNLYSELSFPRDVCVANSLER